MPLDVIIKQITKWSDLVSEKVSSIEQLKKNCHAGFYVGTGVLFLPSLLSLLHKTSGFFLQLPAGI